MSRSCIGYSAAVTCTLIFDRHDGPPDVEVSIAGLLYDDPAGWLSAAKADPRLRPGMAVLVDVSRCDPRRFSSSHARSVAEALAGDVSTPVIASSVAVVASEPALYGCARMALAYYEIAVERRGTAGVAIEIFASRAEAVAWLHGLPVAA